MSISGRAGYYQEHRELYAQYKQIRRLKKQAAFKEKKLQANRVVRSGETQSGREPEQPYPAP